MGLRSRVKKRIRSLVGRERSTGNTPGNTSADGSAAAPQDAHEQRVSVQEGAAAASPKAAPSSAPAPSVASTPSPDAGSSPQASPEAPTTRAAPPKAAPALAPERVQSLPAGLPEGVVSRGRGGAVTRIKPPPDADEEAKRLEKQRKFMLRARKGVLKQIADAGGELHMKDMHDYSERRFFIAHRAFSEMMEFFVEEELITFDPSTMIARITQSGRDFIEA